MFLAVILDDSAGMWWIGRSAPPAHGVGHFDSLDVALTTRKPRPGLIHNNDRGEQRVRAGYIGQLNALASTRPLVDRACPDNAAAESFFATVYDAELLRAAVLLTRKGAKKVLVDYVEGLL